MSSRVRRSARAGGERQRLVWSVGTSFSGCRSPARRAWGNGWVTDALDVPTLLARARSTAAPWSPAHIWRTSGALEGHGSGRSVTHRRRPRSGSTAADMQLNERRAELTTAPGDGGDVRVVQDDRLVVRPEGRVPVEGRVEVLLASQWRHALREPMIRRTTTRGARRACARRPVRCADRRGSQ